MSKKKKKIGNRIQGDIKVPFSLAITPKCRERNTLFPGLLHFTPDPHLIMPTVKQGVNKSNKENNFHTKEGMD